MFFAATVWIAGIVAAIGVAVLAVFCFLSVLQLAMISSKEKVVMQYSAALIGKLALALLASKYGAEGSGRNASVAKN